MKKRFLLIVVVIAALAVTWSLVGDRDVDVPTPGRGSAVATFLADGRPVFVVTDRAGRTSVVDAISTHRPYGVGYLVGWCRSAGTFDDPFHGSRFRADGRYLMGPATTDLPTYPFERVSGDVVIVGPATTPTRRTVGGAVSVPTVCPAGRLIEPAFPDAEWISPADAVTEGDGWTTVTAELRVSPGGAELCAGTRCVDVAVDSRIGGGPFSYPGRWLVRVEDGAIVDVVAVPRP